MSGTPRGTDAPRDSGAPFDWDAPPAAPDPGARQRPAPDLPWAQARRTARRSGGHPLPTLDLDLCDALGHALAQPLVARTDLPPFDTSAMDGWAVAGPGPWRLHGRLLAGQSPTGPLADGTAVRIATGAQLPPGATAVLRREHGAVERREDGEGGALLHDRAPHPAAPGRDVRPRGQECRHGEPLLPAGTSVTPSVLGLAAATGYDRLTVHRRPTVELLLLGDELLEAGPPRDGLVRDALGPLLLPWLDACGARVIGRRMVKDDLGLLRDALRHSPADVVVTTGGTAAGPVDFLHQALTEVGARLLVDSVAVRPGHPMLLAELELEPAPAPGTPARRVVGLPGNPLAAVAGAATLAVPLLRALGGHADGSPRRVPTAAELPGHPRDTRLLPVRLTEQGAHPLAFDGPAMLRGLALADALAVVPPGGLPAAVPVELLAVPGR
ncbi:molybdopterin molybdotransferase MoeA [Peterkaempfera bronchialis]|uniref:molybdopterin molybdotransferase MoeA n=1 Tax=Peterkaempfera bronchialis TaxID=2126346 RepID=UPI001E3B6600|nr:molybdopterin molybdotransferase MoeA [Peterkaempfera bronchialis]